MERTCGSPDITVALIDGPVAMDHPDLAGQRIREITSTRPAGCANRDRASCGHGTFVAGILAAKRGSVTVRNTCYLPRLALPLASHFLRDSAPNIAKSASLATPGLAENSRICI